MLLHCVAQIPSPGCCRQQGQQQPVTGYLIVRSRPGKLQHYLQPFSRALSPIHRAPATPSDMNAQCAVDADSAR